SVENYAKMNDDLETILAGRNQKISDLKSQLLISQNNHGLYVKCFRAKMTRKICEDNQIPLKKYQTLLSEEIPEDTPYLEIFDSEVEDDVSEEEKEDHFDGNKSPEE
ncbi:hypothetical protein MKW92_053528, partial [Papaver armeniacum]